MGKACGLHVIRNSELSGTITVVYRLARGYLLMQWHLRLSATPVNLVARVSNIRMQNHFIVAGTLLGDSEV